MGSRFMNPNDIETMAMKSKSSRGPSDAAVAAMAETPTTDEVPCSVSTVCWGMMRRRANVPTWPA